MGAARRIGPAVAGLLALASAANAQPFDDVHVHLTNYVQRGTDIRSFLALMGTQVQRAAIFGIPLQQQWSARISGSYAPTYYLDTDAPLYYYSFTDAVIASAYRSLPPDARARFDPMITGFNPADMYAADHVRRVLETFPGVFSGIGEFSIHKEFVSSKIAGGPASLIDPALDRLLDFAADVGLVVLIHNDADMPFARPGEQPVYVAQLEDLFRRHRRNTFIWAHVGVGRVVRPVADHAGMVRAILDDPTQAHVNFDLSWSEAAKYLLSTEQSTRTAVQIINAHPDRFLFGTDEVAPTDRDGYLRTFRQYAPLWRLLTPAAAEKVRRGNFERLFDEARRRVRAWERGNVHPATATVQGQ